MKTVNFLVLLFAIMIFINGCNENENVAEDYKAVTYMPNNADNGMVPIDNKQYDEGDWVKILGNSGNLIKTNYAFNGWNTMPDGEGMHYLPDTFIVMDKSSLVLYAQWLLVNKYSVIYDANGAESGTVPIEINKYVEGTILKVLDNSGNLAKSNYRFNGWNSKPDGSGIHYAVDSTLQIGNSDLVLYAEWQNTLKYITLDVTSSSFRPAMEFGASAKVIVDYGDGGQVLELQVDKGIKLLEKYTYTDGENLHKVKINVTPWDAITVLNLGFRGGDGGNGDRERDLSSLPYIAFHPTFQEIPNKWSWEQEETEVLNYVGTIKAVNNLSIASNLVAFCCEYQPIDTLDLSGCSNLLSLEGFFSKIKVTNFQGCTAMHRCCLENTGAQHNWRIEDGTRIEDEVLDLRDCPDIRDIRGTGDNHTMLRLHANAVNTIWHLCKMSNWRMGSVKIGDEDPTKLKVSRFSNLTECWISGSPVIENLVVSDNNPNLYSMWLSNCGIKTVNVENQTQIQVLELTGNPITEINIKGCVNIAVLTLNDCSLSQNLVDSILSTLDGFNLQTTNEYNRIDLSGNNSTPSEDGMTHVSALRSRGWNVIIKESN